MKFIYIVFVVFMALISCGKEKTKELGNKLKSSTTVVDSFEYKLKNKPKIFLKYWSGMSYKEYSRVSAILIKEGKIKEHNFEEYYNLGNLLIKIEPFSLSKNTEDIFILNSKCEFYKENNKYDGILLRNIDTAGYEYFRLKYSLKKLVKQPRYVASLIENSFSVEDPFHTPKTLKFYDSIYTNQLLSERLFDFLYDSYPIGSSETYNFIIGKRLVIENKNNILIFNTISRTCRDREMLLVEKEQYKNFDDAKKEAKTLIKLNEKNTENIVLYLPRQVYEEYIKKIESKKLKKKEVKEAKRKKETSRKSEVLNEI